MSVRDHGIEHVEKIEFNFDLFIVTLLIPGLHGVLENNQVLVLDLSH